MIYDVSMYSFYRLSIILIMFLIVVSTIFVYSLSYNYVVDRKIFMNGSIDVVYKASFEKSRVLVKIYNVDYNDPVVLSMFIWMPNGSVVDIGKTFFKGSYGEIDYRYLANVYDEWDKHLKVIGARPGSIDIGLIILGTIHKKDGVYTLATAVPLNPEYISKRLGIEITINKKLIKTLDINEIKKINISKRSDEIRFSEKESLIPIAHAQTTTWPPRYIYETCYESGLCFTWVLRESKVAYNVNIPLVAVAIRNSWDRVRAVNLYEMLKAGSTSGVRVVFGIGAGVKTSSGGLSYEIWGYDWVANDETAASLLYFQYYYPGIHFNGQSILYIGFKGDIAYVRYQFAYCYIWWYEPQCEYTDIDANTTMTRPVNGEPLTNNIAVSGVVSIYDYNNIVNQVYRDLVEKGWFSSPYKISYDAVHLDLEIMKDEQNTLSQFLLNVDVIKMLIALGLLASKPVFETSVLTLVAPIGGEPYSAIIISPFAYADIILMDRGDWACYQYARSPVQYKYGTSQYIITMMFLDVWVDATANPPERSCS